MSQNNFRKPVQIVLLLVLSFCFQKTAKATHIIGGDMFYDCLGFLNGDPTTNQMVYRITLDLYRDCQAQNAAWFDRPAGVTIFEQSGTNYIPIDFIDVFFDFGDPRDIDPPMFPCLNIPSNVCVHTARYQFETTLPLSNESYHIVWQRCCRNHSINNIFFPEEEGVTFTVEITPRAQQTCNSSPRFVNFPPTVICAGEPLRFDHRATDADGDDLVYEFCAPFTGGGRTFGGGGGCDSPNPNPDCPPPFNTVNFRVPNYTASFPLGGNPRVDIDPVTGLIRGVPENLGQFVVGVCVKEFRNGVLLSTIRRDFQFNVSTCQANFRTNLNADDVLGDGTLVIESCNDLSVSIQNSSVGLIDSVRWEVDLGDSLLATDEWSPTLEFPRGGSFGGLFIINPNTPCSDSSKLRFDVVEALQAGFFAEYDTCDPGPVLFQDTSFVIGSQIISYEWDMDERLEDTVRNPIAVYEDPGQYLISLIVTDTIGCQDTARQFLVWQPAPEVIIIEPDVEEGCVPLDVGFVNRSFPIDSTYDLTWYFSDGDTAYGFNPQKSFTDTGVYSIRLEITSPIGCFDESAFDSVIQVFPLPVAGFEASSYTVSIEDATVTFTDTSFNNVGREWWLENVPSVYFDSILTYTFVDTGLQSVTMYAVDRFGCLDSITKEIDVLPLNTLFFPNAFTPNTDGKNDDFFPVGLTEGITEYELKIFNRWGEEVFSATDVDDQWNGQVRNEGEACPEGVYIVECQYTKVRGEKEELKFFLSLIR